MLCSLNETLLPPIMVLVCDQAVAYQDETRLISIHPVQSGLLYLPRKNLVIEARPKIG